MIKILFTIFALFTFFVACSHAGGGSTTNNDVNTPIPADPTPTEAPLPVDVEPTPTEDPFFSDDPFDLLEPEESELEKAIVDADDELAKKLIEEGADLTTKNSTFFGDSPLHLAIRFYSYPVALVLIEKGADVNVKNDAGVAPIHLAAAGQDSEVIEKLIAAGADVNAKDSGTGGTPLHWTTSVEIAEILIAAGADLSIKNDNGKTPAEHHEDSTFIDLAEFFKNLPDA